MKLKINGEDTKLKFGLRFCREMDEIYKVDYEGLEFGMGVNMALMNLRQKNPVALSNVVKGATAHKEFTQDEVDEAIEIYGEDNGDLGKLFEQVIDELGKSSTVKATVEHFQANARVEEETKA